MHALGLAVAGALSWGMFTNSLKPWVPVLFSGASLSRWFLVYCHTGIVIEWSACSSCETQNFLGKQNYCGYPCCFENTLIVPSIEMLHTVIVSLNRW